MTQPHDVDNISIRIAGVVETDPDISTRPPARVIVEMPDDVAEGLAHILADAEVAAGVFGGFQNVGIDVWPIAEALHDIATRQGYVCRVGGLRRQ